MNTRYQYNINRPQSELYDSVFHARPTVSKVKGGYCISIWLLGPSVCLSVYFCGLYSVSAAYIWRNKDIYCLNVYVPICSIHRNLTSLSRLPPWSQKPDPVCLVCIGSIQPLSQLTVPPRTSNVSENSQRSTTRQTVVTCTEPSQLEDELWNFL